MPDSDTTPELKPAEKHLLIKPPEPWLHEWITPLLQRHPEIEQVYVLGKKARGAYGQKPDYSLLLYAGYNRALELMMALARAEENYRTMDGIIHLYVENYGATFCGIWGGSLITHELNRDWQNGIDYLLWVEQSTVAGSLADRLRQPEDRRRGDRRSDQEPQAEERDKLETLWPGSEAERRQTDRRRSYEELVELRNS